MRALRECRLNKTSAFVQLFIDASAAIPLRKCAAGLGRSTVPGAPG
jgi:hypothetical protein